ncbi:MAG: hypothetical protein MI717_06355, partial [Spirochaetales bacterium]|nr:hypothetical protein [Spirochaetales bacterium]
NNVSSGFVADIDLVNKYDHAYQIISWDVTGTSGTYDLEYSTDNGASWTSIYSDYTTASGEFFWHVPNDPSTQALVRVIDSNNGLIVDQSDAVFTIGQADPVLFTPNGGELLLAGLSEEITWEEGLFVASAIVIDYSTDNGLTWNSITTGTDNDGSYDWTLPDVYTEEGLVRVSEFGNTSVYDTSDAVFTMYSYITLTAPLGGESLNGCETLSIQWYAGQTSGKYRIEYSEDGGSTWNIIADNHSLSGTFLTYNWTLPNINTSDLIIRVSDYENTTKNDMTGSITLANSQYLNLTSPNGGESMISGTVFPIDYVASGPVSSVKLWYSSNDGTSWNTITSSTSGGSYNWTIPNVDSDECLGKVQDVSNSWINDISEAHFSLNSNI